MQSLPLDVIQRAHRGDFTGMQFAGLVRLSFELNPNRERPDVPFTGADINNREEQEQLCREYVQSRGGTYIGTYDEPHTSAWKKKRVTQPDGTYVYRVIRPVFEGMLADLKAGRTESKFFTPLAEFQPCTVISGAIVYDVDRLTRDNRHMEDAIETVEFFNRPIIDITGTLDLLTENGRDMARVMVTMAGKQSAATSRRVKNIHRAMAREGIPVGGTRPFGWKADKRAADPAEKKLIKDAAQDLLDGVNVNTVLKEWEKQEVRTPRGNFWVRSTFIHMMTSPRMVGWRVYGSAELPLHERYARDADGNPIKAQYDAVLDEKVWRAVVALLKDPDRPGAGVAVGKLKYMCSGIIRCGQCASKLRGNAKAKNSHEYVCDGCRGVTGSGRAIDKLITELVVSHLEQEQVGVQDIPWPKEDELAQLEAAKANLLQQFKDNSDMGSYIWPEIRKKETEISKLTKERAAYLRKTAKPKAGSALVLWPDLKVEQRREICAEIFETIILHPAIKGANRFNPARLQVVYAQESAQSAVAA